MGAETRIEWCDATLNLWWGCTKVSDGCKFCYAEHLSDQRFERGAWGPGGVRTEVKSWRSTLNRISKRAKSEGRRLRVFCQSMSDTFEGPETCGGDNSENYALICRLQMELMFAILDHPEIDFLLLTKRPENVMPTIRRIRYHGSERDHPDFQRLYDELIYPWTGGIAPPNVWIGTSVENQATADERIPELLKIPAAVRFLSCEPLLGPVGLDNIYLSGCAGSVTLDSLRGIEEWDTDDDSGTTYSEQHIDWVIVGGESGPHARPMHPDWARSLRDQCQAAGVPFLFKQWGEWVTSEPFECDDPMKHHLKPGSFIMRVNGTDLKRGWGPFVVRHDIGKKAAGRLLDGRTWDEFPEVPA